MLLIVACATRDAAPQKGFDDERAEYFFTVGYEDVSDIYIEKIDVNDLALAGFNGLAKLDPALAIETGSGQVRLTYNGNEIGSYPIPEGADADEWGKLTASVISLARSVSPTISDMNSESVYEAVVDGLMTRLDAFSRYAGREAARENRASRDGFGGIGVRIRMEEPGVLILSVMENTPAERAGLKADDTITHIDGKPVTGMTQHDAVDHLRGRVGSEVAVTVSRPQEPAPLSISIKREHIVPQTVMLSFDGNVAVLEVTGFNQSTTRRLRQKVHEAQEGLGRQLSGYVVDLRNNPGGLLDQAVAVSDLFVSRGRIVYTEGRHPDSYQYFDADLEDVTKGKPIVVLVNGSSASASEIVAAALQDSGRAVVIGSSSFGKGTVQTLLRLPNQGELTLTWARFHAPSGYTLHGRGVLPDICTSGKAETAAAVFSRLDSGDFPIPRSIQTSQVSSNDETAIHDLRAYCPARDGLNDIDLEVALALLREPRLFARALNDHTVTATGAPSVMHN